MAEVEEKDKLDVGFYIFCVALPIAMGLLLTFLVVGLAFCIDKENKSQWNKKSTEATYTTEQVVSYVKENEIPVYFDGETIDIDSVDLEYYDWSFNEEKNVLRLHARNQSLAVIPVPIFIW